MVVPSKSIGRRRLMALGDYVEKNARRKSWRQFFDMRHWLGKVRDMKPGTNEVIVNNKCGTTACLLGHATNVPSIYKAGLRAIVTYKFGAVLCLASDPPGVDASIHEITETLFGITDYRSSQFFCEGGFPNKDLRNVTPEEAVRNLRKVVKEIDQNEGWKF